MSQIKTSGLCVTLGSRAVLEEINLSLQRGQVTAIIGPNGAGKSTLLDCLAGLRRPDQGKVYLDAAPLLELKSQERAKRIAYLPQYSELAWEIDGETLVGLGRTPHCGPWGRTAEDTAAVRDAMVRTSTSEFANRPVATLSGGERARLLLARALATDPQWLLADEPLAGLDPGHCLDVVALFRELAHKDGRGVILTLHDLTLALKAADRVILLSDARVLADNVPSKVLASEFLEQAYGISTALLKGNNGYVLETLARA